MKKDTLPDNPADAREMNRGHDVLKTYMPEPWLSATPARERQCVNACAGMADPAATIEALQKLARMVVGLDCEARGPDDLQFVIERARALCARDGKAVQS